MGSVTQKSIRIVGGGWYGCHIAKSLSEAGYQVTLFEKEAHLFDGASGNNQSRLHLGFHYPRDAVTRRESLTDSKRFMEAYGFALRAVKCNVYAVAERISLIDYPTYVQIMTQSGNQFVEIPPGEFGMANLEGAMLTGEMLIKEGKARKFFEEALAGKFETGVEITKLEGDWDWTIDCTFGAFGTHEVEWFEPCVMLIYRGDDDFALTVMDGPQGASIYPYYRPGRVTLTTVEHTPIHRSADMAEARRKIDRFRDSKVWRERVRSDMEARVSRYYPHFSEQYEYEGFALAIRVKPRSHSDRRACYITRPTEKVIRVFPGKITGCLDAAGIVEGIIWRD